MPTRMITRVDDYFNLGCGRCDRFATPECSTRPWIKGLEQLRRICLAEDLFETVKWAHPCYMHAGRNIVVMGAFRNNFRLTFSNAALLADPDRILSPRGPNTQHADMICFRHIDDVARLAPTIRKYLREAMSYAEAGIKPPMSDNQPVMPAELADAIEADPELAEAFHALTPGRQKSYLLNINSAKKPETRHARINRFRPNIIAGKGAVER